MNREDLKSMNFIVKDKKGELRKSLSDDLGYSSDFKLDKTGYEIKEKLKLSLLERIFNKNLLLKQLQECSDIIGIPPMGTLDNHMFRGLRHKLQYIPHKYSYDQIYPKVSNEPSEVNEPLATEKPPVEDQNPSKDKMREYNKKLNKYTELSVDCVYLKSIIDNISEKKVYSLNPAMIIKLGF
jgi:hypothetical protein